MNALRGEPVAAAALAQAIVAVALVFGFRVPADVVGAIVPVLSVVLGLLARSRVSPVAPVPAVQPGSTGH